jgi:tetratricopeptide (TPR) repeat protein
MLRKICLLLFILILVYSISQAIELNPRDAEGYYNQGIAWYNKGDYDQAISDYNKAIELNPSYADAYNNRGNAWIKKGDYDRAISDYNKAIEINPRDAKAYFNRGIVWAKKGDYDRAASDYNKAIELNPRLVEAYKNQGNDWYRIKEVNMLEIIIIVLILVGLTVHRYLSAYWEEEMLPYSWGFLFFANLFAILYLINFIWLFGLLPGIIISVLIYFQIVYSAGFWIFLIPWLQKVHRSPTFPQVNPMVYGGFSLLIIILGVLTAVNFFFSKYKSLWKSLGYNYKILALIFLSLPYTIYNNLNKKQNLTLARAFRKFGTM